MLFNCSLLATGLCNLTNTPYDIQGAPPASYNYSAWRITNCSPQQTQILINTLDQMNTTLPKVIQEVKKGTETIPYRIFFKRNRQIPLIDRVFSQMAVGEQVKAADELGAIHLEAPELICVKPKDFTSDYWNRCQETDLDAVTFDEQPFIVVCPAFWTRLYPSQATQVKEPTCPNSLDNFSMPKDDIMLSSKLAILIHELVHLYRDDQIVPELYTMRACASLNAAKSVRNANNYAFFAMGKSSMSYW